MDYKKLVEAAINARKMSYTPYSNFKVGAALLTKSGKTFTGCNIESAAYTPTNCAERTALFKAVSEGEREFLAIAVVGAPAEGESNFCYPCGVCRQMLKEFVSDDFILVIAKSAEEYKVHKFGEILPYSFGPEDLMI